MNMVNFSKRVHIVWEGYEDEDGVMAKDEREWIIYQDIAICMDDEILRDDGATWDCSVVHR